MKQILQSKTFHILLGVGISVALILWLVSEVKGQKVVEHLSGINYWMLIPCTVLMLVQYVIRALRWRYLLPPGSRVELRTLFDSMMLGNFGTYVLPLRAGEFVRPLVLSRQTDYTFPIAFVSVVTERFFDLSVVLLFFAGMTLLLPVMPPLGGAGVAPEVLAKTYAALNVIAFMLSLLALAIFVFIAVGAFFPGPVLRLLDVCLQPLPEGIAGRVRAFARDFLSGTAVLRNPRNLGIVIALSFAVWGLTVSLYYIYFWLFPQMQPSWWLAFVVTVLLAFFVAAPSAPGFIGVYHAGCAAAFVLTGVDLEQAAAYAVATHLSQFLLIVIYGGYLLVKYGMRLGELWHARDAV